ncbi:hypothetical protein ACHHYP_15052 [Achlya hypogyna]|uniref:Uncharacterized protein n=1 Tax=Achlya hypogyna TaxID=1202772 RepID=A0A1V9YBR7_ACHHY|nr:hypothetical protein ACHHYP_15052 [Achlya hypogyna]
MPDSLWLNPVVRLLLLGTHDNESPLRKLRGLDVIVRAVLDHLMAVWRAQLCTDRRGYVQLREVEGMRISATITAEPIEFRPHIVTFPPPLTRFIDGMEMPKPFHVNMMPFIIGDRKSLPPECQRYVQLLNECYSPGQQGKVGYLTIHEGVVEAGASQRRPGLHVEAPNAMQLQTTKVGGGASSFQWREIRWGRGWYLEKQLLGGIYMASTVANSCSVWNTVVADDNDIVGTLGETDVLYGTLDRDRDGYYELQANELIWITDRTPHESLPVATTQFRQYFRFVTSDVSVWFADHSTPNPLGIQPTATIIHGSKFDGNLSIEPKAKAGTP